MNLDKLAKFYIEMYDMLGEDPLAMAQEIYNKDSAITGTHFKLWNSQKKKDVFWSYIRLKAFHSYDWY